MCLKLLVSLSCHCGFVVPSCTAWHSALNAHAPELLVFLRGMLFTNIQLNDFSSTLSQFLECLSIEVPEE